MRTALETIKKNYKGAKLEDGLPIGGRNRRLTDDKIHQLRLPSLSKIYFSSRTFDLDKIFMKYVPCVWYITHKI